MRRHALVVVCQATPNSPTLTRSPDQEACENSGFESISILGEDTIAQTLDTQTFLGLPSLSAASEDCLKNTAPQCELVMEGIGNLNTAKGRGTTSKDGGSTTNVHITLPVASDALRKRLRARKRLLKQAEPHMSEKTLQRMRRSFLFAHKIGMPLNSFLTIDVTKHDDDYTADGFRDRFMESIKYAWGNPPNGPAGLYSWENARQGGVGNHFHLLAHIPTTAFGTDVCRIVGVLAKRFSKELDRLLELHRHAVTAHGLTVPAKNVSALAKYLALLEYRRRKRAQIFTTASIVGSGDDQSTFIQLPFYFSRGGLHPDKLPERPFTYSDAENVLRYVCKSADPSIKHTYNGQVLTLKQMSKDDGDHDWVGYRDACALQSQSTRRFPRRTCAATYMIGPRAQRALVKGFIDKDEPVAEWFVPRLSRAKIRRGLGDALTFYTSPPRSLPFDGMPPVRAA